jgi:CRP/FNR family cyclic AMP-dependent transcriptional regulator
MARQVAGSFGIVDQLIDQPISLDAVIEFLVRAPLFADLDAIDRGEVVRILEVQRLQDSEEVFHEGEDGDSWYVIFEGRVSVTKASRSGPSRQIAMLEAGSGFGEMAMLDGAPRSATVTAVGPLTIFRFRRSRFEDLLTDGSLGAYKVVAAMAREQSQRLRQITDQAVDLMDRGDQGETGAESVPSQIGALVEQCEVSE